MNAKLRMFLGLGILTAGFTAQAALEKATETERPPLARSLKDLPEKLGGWTGKDVEMDPEILRQTQATDWIHREYQNPQRPGCALRLWMNYSTTGLNLRHSPEVCLPSGGWTKVEAQTRVREIPRPSGTDAKIMRLGYAKGDMVQQIGFWYYIFGEGSVERYVRQLPITSRSSHGRTTRGSGLTVEVFCPGANDPDGEALTDFATALLNELEPILPKDRAPYFIP